MSNNKVFTNEEWTTMLKLCEDRDDGDLKLVLEILRDNENFPTELSALNEALLAKGLPLRQHSWGDHPAYGYTIKRINNKLWTVDWRFQIRKVGHIRGTGQDNGLVQLVRVK